MKGVKIKETYLLFLIVMGLVSLAVYSTYALFTASTEIENVVDFTATLTTDSSILEYEMVRVAAGETKIIEVNVVNSYSSELYYGVWYEMVSPSSITDEIEIGIYTEKDDTPSSGIISADTTLTLLVGITNNSSSEAIVNVGTVGSLTSNLGLSDNRILLSEGWTEAILVTDEYLEENTTTTTETINLEYEYTGSVQEVTLSPGTYKLEVWGAEGGSYSASIAAGGKGGYSYGTLTLEDETTAYVYVGGQGSYYTTTTSTSQGAGGFNGGGDAGYGGGTGGGGTDIRLGSDSLYARVIVAGGGGGAYAYNSTYKAAGGAAGGTTGTSGSYYSSSYSAFVGGGATQTSGGAAGTGSSTNYNGTAGTFGQGGSTGYKYNNASYYSNGAGGGGWYGGGGAGNYSGSSRMRAAGGGGGSGYVYTSSTASNYPSGCLLNPLYYLTDAATIAGDQSFTDFDGTTVTGHSGNGAVRISGTAEVISYTIPRLTGLNDLMISVGESYDLTSDVTLICEINATGCSIVGTNIIDTSTLEVGTYIINYTITNSSNKKYIYTRNLIVTDLIGSELTLAKLGLSVNSETPNFENTSCSSGCGETTVGIYSAEDDLGTSYYFRGDVENNYVYFAGFYWRIIRINGDGTIRMIYDGTSANLNGTSSTSKYIGSNVFNSYETDNAYVGYMYGTLGAYTYANTHANTNNSVIKNVLDEWYVTNIVNKEYSSYVADAIYCNDRSVYSGDGIGNGTSLTKYNSGQRTLYDFTPTLKCIQENDRFTVNDTIEGIVGNSDLTYPVATISVDEVMFAGGNSDVNNTKFYLYSGNYYWTLSPTQYTGYYANYLTVSSSGKITNSSGQNGYRPVISLKSDVLKYDAATSNGTMSYPFILK